MILLTAYGRLKSSAYDVFVFIGNKACVLQIAPVCMTENLGTKNLKFESHHEFKP